MDSELDLVAYIKELIKPIELNREAVPDWIFDSISATNLGIELIFSNSRSGDKFRTLLSENPHAGAANESAGNFILSFNQPVSNNKELIDLKFILDFTIKKRDRLEPGDAAAAWRNLRKELGIGADNSDEKIIEPVEKRTAPGSKDTGGAWIIPHNKSGVTDEDEFNRKLIEFGRLKPAADSIYHMMIYTDCMNKCVFCVSANDPNYQLPPNYSYEHYKKILALNESYKLKFLRLSGNEILLYDRIIDLIAEAKNAGFADIEIHTSGYGLQDEKFAASVIGAGVNIISVPIYSCDEAVHDCVAGRKGSYRELIATLEHLKKTGVRVYLRTLILNQNLKSLDSLIRMCNEYYPAFGLSFIVVRPASADLQHFRSVAPKFTDISTAVVSDSINSVLPFCITAARAPGTDFRARASELKKFDIGELRISDLINGTSQQVLGKRFLPDVCEKCILNEICPFPFREYIAIYGDGEFKPFVA